jgi:Flp pilus assembly pilin Flp
MIDMIRAHIYELMHREEGQGLTEYALILSLILVGVAALLVSLNGKIQNALTSAVNAF